MRALSIQQVVGLFVRPLARIHGRDALWESLTITRMTRMIQELFWGSLESLITFSTRWKMPSIIDHSDGGAATTVDRYWGSHTVRGRFFFSKKDSLDYVSELTDGRPLKRKLLRLHGPHTGKTILDYGCGPGNDLAGFAESSGAARIIGMDISRRALKMARSRLSLHGIDPNKLSFIRISDSDPRVPLSDESIDYIQSLGVIHHTSHPDRIFKEFARILKPDGEIRIMLYNADSVHVQLNIGYLRQLVQGAQTDIRPEESFEKTADLEAPIAHCVRPERVDGWLAGSGLSFEFLGGYFMPGEIEDYKYHLAEALADNRLKDSQRAFLASLTEDQSGFPLFKGKPCGLGAVYRLTKHGHLPV